ncbi:MAG: ComEC/Rec2 family competence protein [Bacteroides sp.]|nr:ComEC/Rec2 family competence protein [Bacteroides sp.]MCM1379460.1 ComEC/Rec2 family competence protein [Bacteroides sp.]MCM1445937.1 ComEC/Rec2 family competence protein [Prevotella sp.]
MRRPQYPPSYDKGIYSARVLSAREAATSGQFLVAEIDSSNSEKIIPFKARIHILSEYPQIYPGQRLAFSGALRPLPEVPAVPDIIDLQKSLRREGVTATAAVPLDSILYIAESARVRTWFARANEYLLVKLMRSNLKPGTINVLAAILLGRSEMLPPQTRVSYSAAGLSHVLALSGMHVSVIAMIIAVALWPFYFGRHVRTRLLLTILALWFYAALTAFIPSVTRAVIMATVYMLGRILQRRSSPLNSLCLAAILILLVNPHDLYAAGFQLSFAAVLGIILFYPLINRVDRRNHPGLYALVSYPALSISAMTFAGIISAYHFHMFPVYFLLANITVVLLIPLLMIVGLLSLGFGLNFGADMICWAMEKVAELISALPGATLSGLYPTVWLTLLLLLLMGIFAYGVHESKRFVAYESALLFFGALICCAVKPAVRYPESETFIIEEPRATQTIMTAGDSCFILTTAALPSEREEIEARYQLILRDFTAKRELTAPILK